MAATRVPLTITYRLAGTQPPIFVAGEFSEPPWDPQEMEYTSDKDGEHTFTKRVLAKAGSKVQYKFRVGTGDWWVLDESAPTARDIGGFLNNVADVPAAASE
jgi:1,4-alpha-glucan branching enzyme